MFELEMFLKDLFLFLMLINPISKIAIVPMLINNKKELQELVLKSSLFGGALLILFAFVGTFILDYVFHLDLSALMVAGGMIIFYFGFQALRKGVFFEFEQGKKLVEIAMVPLASPLIAGPATITFAIYNSAKHSPAYSSLIIVVAIVLNLVVMYFSPMIRDVLNRYNLTGATIRIIGLFVASIGINMVLVGVKNFFG